MVKAKVKAKLQENGRIVIPASFRNALGIKPGDEVMLTLIDGEIKLTSIRESIRKAQAMLRQYVTKERSLSEELIRERREELKND